MREAIINNKLSGLQGLRLEKAHKLSRNTKLSGLEGSAAPLRDSRAGPLTNTHCQNIAFLMF